eukprot:Awhi_evm2s1191
MELMEPELLELEMGEPREGHYSSINVINKHSYTLVPYIVMPVSWAYNVDYYYYRVSGSLNPNENVIISDFAIDNTSSIFVKQFVDEPKTVISATISTGEISEIPTAFTSDIKGSIKSYATTHQMLEIFQQKREIGMLCFSRDRGPRGEPPDNYYQLLEGGEVVGLKSYSEYVNKSTLTLYEVNLEGQTHPPGYFVNTDDGTYWKMVKFYEEDEEGGGEVLPYNVYYGVYVGARIKLTSDEVTTNLSSVIDTFLPEAFTITNDGIDLSIPYLCYPLTFTHNKLIKTWDSDEGVNYGLHRITGTLSAGMSITINNFVLEDKSVDFLFGFPMLSPLPYDELRPLEETYGLLLSDNEWKYNSVLK